MNIYDTNGKLLYESEAETLRGAVEGAVEKGVALTGANLDAANLYLASLIRANLEGASLKGANLEGAVFYKANLDGVNLAGANLVWAGCYKANLKRANLSGVNLRGANLYWANLEGANLEGVNLTGATGIIDTGTDSRGYRWVAVQHDDGPRIKAGCRWYTLAQAHEHWDGDHDISEAVGIECRSRLTLLETLAKDKGWIQ